MAEIKEKGRETPAQRGGSGKDATTRGGGEANGNPNDGGAAVQTAPAVQPPARGTNGATTTTAAAAAAAPAPAKSEGGAPTGTTPAAFVAAPHVAPAGGAMSASRSKRIPPTETFAEIFYYKKQMDAHTPMVIVLQDGEEVIGTIEWYDRDALKINRRSAPNILLLKHNIKYMFKAEDREVK